MSETDLLTTLRKILAENIDDAPAERGFTIFVFGSFTTTVAHGDIDLLITYEDNMPVAQARRLRGWLAELVVALLHCPADICLLSNSEEAEIGLVERESAYKVLERL